MLSLQLYWKKTSVVELLYPFFFLPLSTLEESTVKNSSMGGCELASRDHQRHPKYLVLP
jgi:hypothetical protein